MRLADYGADLGASHARRRPGLYVWVRAVGGMDGSQPRRLRASLIGRHSRSGVLRGNCFGVAINLCLCRIG
jgi:hypothetical protein